MKHILIFSLFLFFSVKGFSQAYMDKIVKESCNCLDNAPDSLDDATLKAKLGMCMLNASVPYKKQIKKDYGIDLDKGTMEEGEKWGKIIGMKMMAVCPNALINFSERLKGKKTEKKEQQSVEGTITKIEKSTYVNFSVKDESENVVKYYWITPVESKMDLKKDYPGLLNKKVKITYTTLSIFEPMLGDYKQYTVIKSINIIE